MAQIVLIAEGTVRTATDGSVISSVGDVVSIHDDDVALTGPGYANFKIVQVSGLTADEARNMVDGLRPETAMGFKMPLDAKPGEFTFSRPEERELRKDGDEWKVIEKTPKYGVNLAGLDDTDIASLADSKADASMKRTIIETKGCHNFASSLNNAVVAELSLSAVAEKGA